MQEEVSITKWGFHAFGGLILLLAAFLFWPLTIVDAGHAGVVKQFGKVSEKSLDSGLHIINPLASVTEIDVRQYPYKIEGAVGTKDLQEVQAVIVVNYHADARSVANLYTQFGPKFWDIIIAPAAQDRLKAVTPNYTAAELVTKRQEVASRVKESVIEAVWIRSHGWIVIDDVVVQNFSFHSSFTEAIQNKQVAEQRALTAERDLQRIKIEAEQQIATARANAESFRLQSQQLTPQMIQMEAIKKWNGTMPTYLGAGQMPFLTMSVR